MGKEKAANKSPLHIYHRYLDEAGDLTFYGKGKRPIVGSHGVSNYFLIGMLTVNEPVQRIRKKIIELQSSVINDRYLKPVRSIQKKNNKTGYFLHATDDVPEVRKMFFEFIASIDCHFDAVIGKKDYSIYEKKHNAKQAELYADLLSHLLIDSLHTHSELILNIAHRSTCTTQKNLDRGLEKALTIAANKYPGHSNCCKVAFNVQRPTNKPIINIADYFLWAIQRKFERGEGGYVDYLGNRIRSVQELYQPADKVGT